MSHTLNTNRIKPSGLIQATSIKHQASGLDRSSSMGYYRSQGQARDGQAIDICGGPLMGPRNSAAEILQQRPIKSPAIGRNGSCRVMVTASPNARFPPQAASLKPQASSLKRANDRFKPQATSLKLKATSYKLLDL